MENEVVVPAAAEIIPPVAPSTDETASTVAAPVSGEVTPEQKPEKTFSQADVDAIVAKEKAKVERRAQRERDRAVAEAATRSQPQAPKAEPAGKPTPDKFATTEDYVEAVAEWKADQKITQRLAERERSEQEATQRRAAEEVAHTYREKEEAVRAKYTDFDEVAYNPRLPISDAMAQTIQLSDQGAELVYYLGKNPGEAARIFNLPPIRQASELGKLEAKLASAPPVKPPSSAPEPISPLGGGKSTVTHSLDTTDAKSSEKILSQPGGTSAWIAAERARQEKKWAQQKR